MKTKKLPKRGYFHSSTLVTLVNGDVFPSTNLHFNEEKVWSYAGFQQTTWKRSEVATVTRWYRGEQLFIVTQCKSPTT